MPERLVESRHAGCKGEKGSESAAGEVTTTTDKQRATAKQTLEVYLKSEVCQMIGKHIVRDTSRNGRLVSREDNEKEME